MSASQCKAARRKIANDKRYQPAKGSRGKLRAMAAARKVMNAGGGARSVGFNKK